MQEDDLSRCSFCGTVFTKSAYEMAPGRCNIDCPYCTIDFLTIELDRKDNVVRNIKDALHWYGMINNANKG